MSFVEELLEIGVSIEAVELILKRFKGSMIYVPMHNKISRNDGIREKFNGRNHRQLVDEYNLSYNQICTITRRKKIYKQVDLFTKNTAI